MSWTKREIVEEAYGELALAGYVFDLDPEEEQAALRKLDTMMAVWDARGVRLGYPLASSPAPMTHQAVATLVLSERFSSTWRPKSSTTQLVVSWLGPRSVSGRPKRGS